MFDLKNKGKIVHDVEPVMNNNNSYADEFSQHNRAEPSLNSHPPEPIEPISRHSGVGWYPGMTKATSSNDAPEASDSPTIGAAASDEPTTAQAGNPNDGQQNKSQSDAPRARAEIPEQGNTNSEDAIPPDISEAKQHSKQDIPQFGLPVDTRNSSPKIGAILLANGKITEQQVQEVLAYQEQTPDARFGELAVLHRFVSQKDVDDALASQFGFSSNSQSSANVASEIVVAHNPFSPFAEALRGLRSQLMLRWFDGSPQQGALAMTSVDRADGKSFICANLGVVFSQLGEKTLIIDGDLRNSTLHKKFGIRNRMGLSGLLSGRAGIDEIIPVPGLNNLAVLPAGPQPPNPQELLGREEFSRFLAAMAGTFDVILIDTPSAQQASDAQVVAQRARAAIIVGRKDKTKSTEISQLGAVMTSSGVKLLGATLNSY